MDDWIKQLTENSPVDSLLKPFNKTISDIEALSAPVDSLLEQFNISKHGSWNALSNEIERLNIVRNSLEPPNYLNSIFSDTSWQLGVNSRVYSPTPLIKTLPKTKRQKQRQAEFKKRDEAENKKIITSEQPEFEQIVLNFAQMRGVPIPQTAEAKKCFLNKFYLFLDKQKPKSVQQTIKRESQLHTYLWAVYKGLQVKNPDKKVTHTMVKQMIIKNYEVRCDEFDVDGIITEVTHSRIKWCSRHGNKSSLSWGSLSQTLVTVKEKFNTKK